MIATLGIIFPIFALIFLGWLARWQNWLGDNATVELNRFVVLLALPALLFDIVANADWNSLWQPQFILSFVIATFFIFAITILIQVRRNRELADSAIDALNTSYANTGFMGFPLLIAILGQEAQISVLIATIVTVCILFTFGIIIIELSFHKDTSTSVLMMFKNVFKKVITNPIVFAPVVATFFPLLNVEVPTYINSMVHLLGDAAAPAALITIGLFLGGSKREAKIVNKTSVLFVFTKLIIHPVIMFVLTAYLFALPSPVVYAAVLLAALPTGTGPFMLSEFYGRDGTMTSNVILLSTAISPLTLTLAIYLLDRI